ncbi:MAG: hypothetical protein QGG73_11235, partial [Candidatus Hydrogenedentes bacterium]|nr:hypothetical protein [Candidatus Hydrogenedentota bacterium]
MPATKKRPVKKTTTSNGAKNLSAKEAGKQRALDLAKEKKGTLTYDDLNDLLPSTATAELID